MVSIAGILKSAAMKIAAMDLKSNLALKIVIVAVTAILISLLFPRGELVEFQYPVGSVWLREDLIAPFSFPIYKPEQEYELQCRAAADSVAPVFRREDSRGQQKLDSLHRFLNHVGRIVELRLRERWWSFHPPRTAGQRISALRDSAVLATDLALLGAQFTDSEWGTFESLIAPGGTMRRVTLRDLDAFLTNSLNPVYTRGILDVEKNKLRHKVLSLRRNVIETSVPVDSFYDLTEAAAHIEQLCQARFKKTHDVGNLLSKVALEFITPTILYDLVATQQERELAVSHVPRTLGVVLVGERIVGEHEVVTPETKLKIDSFLRARAERGGEQRAAIQWLGNLLHTAAILSLLAMYIYLFRKRILSDNSRITLIALLILFIAFLAFVIVQIRSKLPLEYLIVLPVSSMLLAIIFDSRVAFYGTVVSALLLAGIRGNDYAIAVSSIIAGALGVYTVRDIRNRTQIFRSMLFILLGYVVAIVAFGVERSESLQRLSVEIAFAGINALVSPALTYGFLIFIERAFHVATNLTLLELSDFNQPLLRELSEKAPGTFHHSVMMGTLAEAAAEAIGANSILARVGAYYHDIGKTLRPEYYIENQMDAVNRHDALTPQMSALVVTSHVKEGVELGRRYRLPQIVLDFIPQHHGTTLISVFYNKALKQRGRKEKVREVDFRYPGPKPQTKEAGIVMLADAVEATAHTLDDPTPARLEQVIDEIVKQRLMDGQFDECELTLRDLTKIKEAFLRILFGIYHPRIKYPGQEEQSSVTTEEELVQPKSLLGRIRSIDSL